jgi:hypothetical protein
MDVDFKVGGKYIMSPLINLKMKVEQIITFTKKPATR